MRNTHRSTIRSAIVDHAALVLNALGPCLQVRSSRTAERLDNAFEVGTRLRMRFRIKERDQTRGFSRYFWKAAPTN